MRAKLNYLFIFFLSRLRIFLKIYMLNIFNYIISNYSLYHFLLDPKTPLFHQCSFLTALSQFHIISLFYRNIPTPIVLFRNYASPLFLCLPTNHFSSLYFVVLNKFIRVHLFSCTLHSLLKGVQYLLFFSLTFFSSFS